ncbi:MAG: cytochrome C oxidase subunit IV family protein [Flavobacteriaceae bacterium]|nr:cytochrome C oxidase subunit IV family protein [Flavobacteriaceae bacterium]
MAHSHKALIWKVFGILSAITFVEVIFGIVKPDALYLTQFLGTSLLNILFLALTIVKAYYIVWYFMHLGEEKKGLIWSVLAPLLILIPYLAALLLIEGGYSNNSMLFPYMGW